MGKIPCDLIDYMVYYGIIQGGCTVSIDNFSHPSGSRTAHRQAHSASGRLPFTAGANRAHPVLSKQVLRKRLKFSNTYTMKMAIEEIRGYNVSEYGCNRSKIKMKFHASHRIALRTSIH